MLPSDFCLWINKDVLRRRLGESGFTASGQTTQLLSGLDRHETLGTPSDVPVPRNAIREIGAVSSDPVFFISTGYICNPM